jgi:fermentation-respiration switch protein FrsA (DUF1100 family)
MKEPSPPNPADTKRSSESLVLDPSAPSRVKQGSEPPKKRKRHHHKVQRSWPARLLVSTVRILFFAYLALLVGLVLMEERLIYPAAYRSDDVGVRQSDPGEAIQTVMIESTNDVTLPVRLLENPNASRFMLYFHGNGAKAKYLDGRLQQMSRANNATVMAAEYRGYEDDKTPTEKGVIEDCLAARDYLCERFQIEPTDIILYGNSLGGGCAAAVASQAGAKALILERTFDQAYSVAADRFWFVPVRILMRNRFDSMARLTVYRGPLLQIHGDADANIPIEHGKRLFASVDASPKKFIEVPGMGHVDPLPPAVQQQITEWIEDLETANSDPR